MKQRVLFQVNECLNSSTGKIARQIGEAAISHGWVSYIAYSSFEDYQPTKCKTFTVGSKLDYYLHAIETRISDNHGLASRTATRRLVEKIHEIDPDVIHLHNVHGYYLNYKILFDYLSSVNKPVVWTMHDCWAFTGHCAHFVTVGCEKWMKGCYKCPLKKDYPKSYGMDRSQKNYQQKKISFTSVKDMVIVPVSYWLSESLSESYLNKYPVKVINNGIDLDVFKPTEKDVFSDAKEEGRLILLGVANVWCKDKGIDEFIRLSQDERFQVVLVGVTPNVKKTLPNSIIAIERTNNQQELADIYFSADVFVNPTYADTLPTVNIEAIACGTPVVTYRTGGSPEIIDVNTGYVVNQGDFEGLIKGILSIASMNKASRIQQKNLCRARAIARFNKDERFEEYIELYNSLLKK